MKKKLILLSSVLNLFSYSPAIFAETLPTSNITTSYLAPSKIWYEFTNEGFLGYSYFHTIHRKDGSFHGYLSVDWNRSAGGFYTYMGYLYPSKGPYPAMSSIQNEQVQ